MKLLSVMSFIIERMKFNIRSYASALIGYLPELWHESEHHNMLRCAILTTLINLVLVRHQSTPRSPTSYSYIMTANRWHFCINATD